MAVTAARVSVTTAATKICENTASSGAADSSTLSFLILNNTESVSIYLGPSGVTTSTGVEWKLTYGPAFEVSLEPGESLYGIVAATTQVCHVLGGGR